MQISNFNFHRQEFWQESWVAQIQQVQLHEVGLKGAHAGQISINCVSPVLIIPTFALHTGSSGSGGSSASLCSFGVQKAEQAGLPARLCLL